MTKTKTTDISFVLGFPQTGNVPSLLVQKIVTLVMLSKETGGG